MMNILDEAYTLVDDEGNEFEKNDAALKKYFQIFNEDYFDGQLDMIPLTWFKSANLHGYFKPKFIILRHECEPEQISLNLNACGTFAAFRNVFVHEMLHYYVNVYIGLPEENWLRAEQCLQNNNRDGYRIALRNTQETCHEFEWARLAKELSEKYPELGNIETYAIPNAETGVGLYDKAYVINWCKKNVLLRRTTPNGKCCVYCVSVNNSDWLALQKAIETGTGSQRFAGKWERLWPTLDNKNFKFLKTFKNFGKYYYPEIFEPNGKFETFIRKVTDLGTITYSAQAQQEAQEAMISEDIQKYNFYCLDGYKVIKVAKGSKADSQIRVMFITGKGTLTFNGKLKRLLTPRFNVSTWRKLQATIKLNGSYYDMRKYEYRKMFEDSQWGSEYTVESPRSSIRVLNDDGWSSY